MPTQFNWETEDDHQWADNPEINKSPSAYWRTLPWIALLLGSLFAAAVFIHRQFNQIIDAANEDITEEILTSDQIRQQAIAARDFELLNTALSWHYMEWSAVQRDLLLIDPLRDGWPSSISAVSDPQVMDVIISPNLSEAEIILSQEFTWADLPGNVTAKSDPAMPNTYSLKTVITYRKEGERWFYAPPSPEFWGSWNLNETPQLSLSYPDRDAELAKRLADDLGHDITHMCKTLPEINCPKDLHLHVRLDTNPQSIISSNNPSVWLSHAALGLDIQNKPQAGMTIIRAYNSTSSNQLTLPTPSLLGIPESEEGYQALRQYYAAHILALAISESVGWPCCRNSLLYQAFLDKQLSELGLMSWPLAERDYQKVFGGSIPYNFNLADLFYEESTGSLRNPETLQMHSLVDFLMETAPKESIAEMQRRLSKIDNHRSWFGKYEPFPGGFEELGRDWHLYLAAQFAKTPSPLPFPYQDIQLLCHTGNGEETSLLRYDLAANKPQIDIYGRSFIFMDSLPSMDGVILQESLSHPSETQVILRQGKEELVVFENSFSEEIVSTAPRGEDLLLSTSTFSGQRPRFHLIDLDQCSQSNCPVRSLISLPVWSPNGQNAILKTGAETLWLGDNVVRNPTFLDMGSSPFWLDDNTLGYLQIKREGYKAQKTIVVASMPDLEPEVLLPLDTLFPYLPQGILASEAFVSAIQVDPHNPHIFYINMEIKGNDYQIKSGTLLFIFNKDTRKISLMLQTLFYYQPNGTLSFSPNGQWLTIRTESPNNSSSKIYLLNLENGKRVELASINNLGFPGYVWSADSRWLMHVDEDYIHLIAPDYSYQQLLVHEYPKCNFAGWVNKV